MLEVEEICLLCVYYPLVEVFQSDAEDVYFSKELAWYLCRNSIECDYELFHKAFIALVSLGFFSSVPNNIETYRLNVQLVESNPDVKVLLKTKSSRSLSTLSVDASDFNFEVFTPRSVMDATLSSLLSNNNSNIIAANDANEPSPPSPISIIPFSSIFHEGGVPTSPRSSMGSPRQSEQASPKATSPTFATRAMDDDKATSMAVHALEDDESARAQSFQSLDTYGTTIMPVSLEPKLVRPDRHRQIEVYYIYWTSKLIQINSLIESNRGEHARFMYSQSVGHIEPFLNALAAMPTPLGLVGPDIVLDIVCRLEPAIKGILSEIFSPDKVVTLLKSFLRVFCDGDDSGAVREERYWRPIDNVPIRALILDTAQTLGNYLRQLRQPSAAEEVLRAANSNLFEDEGCNYYKALFATAESLMARGKVEEAEDLKEKCATVQSTLLIHAFIHFDHASVLIDLNRFDEAMQSYERCYLIQRDLFTEKHSDCLTTLTHMANLFNRMNRHEEALVKQKECFDLLKESEDISYINVALILGGIGDSHRALGNHDEALSSYLKAVAMYQQEFGETHVETIRILTNIGGVYRSLGRLTDALDVYQRCLDLLTQLFGADHVNTTIAMQNIAFTYHRLNRPHEALAMLDNVLAIRSSVVGEEGGVSHLVLADGYANRGLFLQAVHRFDEAISSYEKARFGYSVQYGPTHPKIEEMDNEIKKLKRKRKNCTQQ